MPSPDAEKFGGYGGMIINGQIGSDDGFKLVDIAVEEINRFSLETGDVRAYRHGETIE